MLRFPKAPLRQIRLSKGVEFESVYYSEIYALETMTISEIFSDTEKQKYHKRTMKKM